MTPVIGPLLELLQQKPKRLLGLFGLAQVQAITFDFSFLESPMTDLSSNPHASPSDHIDLWKFFEDRGSKLKDSMFTVVSWLIGFASAILAFAAKEGFKDSFTHTTNPQILAALGVAGLLLIIHAKLVVDDYGEHINRTFNRADAARQGETSPQKIWDEGMKRPNQTLPPACLHMIIILYAFAAAFVGLIIVAVSSLR